MAAMGFSAQTSPFKPPSFAPPYWFSYSRPHAFSFSKSRSCWAASRKVLVRCIFFTLIIYNLLFFLFQSVLQSFFCLTPKKTMRNQVLVSGLFMRNASPLVICSEG